MKKRHLLILAAAMLMFGCGKDTKELLTAVTISPEAGATYPAGKEIAASIELPEGLKIDSVIYLLDTTRVGSKTDASALTIKTDGLPLGTKLITANVYAQGQSQEVSTNIALLAAKAPEILTYTVEKVFPHDTTSYTEGLEYHNGYLYESDGGYLIPPNDREEVTGQSSLRKVDLTTGKVLQQVLVDPKIFAEGMTIIGDKILQLTYREKIAYVYDKSTFKLLETLNYTAGVEGWGLCFDGEKIYATEGSNAIIFLDKNDYHQTGRIGVYDDKGQVVSINELEYIDGKLYANVYGTDDILVIDPKTGAVLQKVDLTNLYPKPQRNTDEVLNGIAWDAKGKRLFVTGKNWDKLFQIKLSPAK